MNEQNYHKQQDLINIKKTREILETLPQYVKTFLRGIENKTAPRTQVGYLLDIRIFFDFILSENPSFKNKTRMDISLSDLSKLQSEDFEDFMHYLKSYERNGRIYSNNERGIKHKMSAIRVFYGYLYKNNKISENPTLKVDMPKLHDKAIVRLDIDETAKFLDAIEYGDSLTDNQKKYHEKNKTRDLALITLMLSTGIRVSECVGLNIEDIDFNNSRIKITRKGGYEAFVFFSDEASIELENYLLEREKIITVTGHEQALFLSSHKKRISVRSVELLVKKYARGVTPLKKITPHKLRSTYGTSLYQETSDIYLVADILGHKDVNTTKKHYADIDEAKRRYARNKVHLREKR